LHEDTR
jgi:hypothetical protein